jgi:hypothetical protein
VTSARPSSPAIPWGIQEGSEAADMADEWEMVSMEDFAMAAVREGAEGLMLDYADVQGWTQSLFDCLPGALHHWSRPYQGLLL